MVRLNLNRYMRHLSDCVRGEYRDRLIVTNPDLRLYTRALNIFTEFQARIQVHKHALHAWQQQQAKEEKQHATHARIQTAKGRSTRTTNAPRCYTRIIHAPLLPKLDGRALPCFHGLRTTYAPRCTFGRLPAAFLRLLPMRGTKMVPLPVHQPVFLRVTQLHCVSRPPH
jgi:hypothetical protein